MAMHRPIVFGTFLSLAGENMGAWRHRNAPAYGRARFADYLDAANRAEAGMIDLLLVADVPPSSREPLDILSRYAGYDRLEPLSLVAALAVTTQHIGLVATASTTYNEPYRIARAFASLDHLSAGRAGWNIVTTMTDTEALNFSRTGHAAASDRYARAEEFVDVARGLWRSFTPDAFVRDKQSGRYFEPHKLHVLDHQGAHFSVRGPLDIAPSPQGAPLLVQAGSSGPGMALGARVADVIFSTHQSIASARAFRASLHAQAAGFGRQPEDVIALMALIPVVGASAADARAKFEAIQALIDPVVALPQLSSYLGGVDLSGYDLDAPLPDDLPEGDGVQTTSRRAPVLELAHRDGLTLRQLAAHVAGTRGHRTCIGTAGAIADDLEEWVSQGAADGFILVPPLMPESLTDFTREVMPELQRRGLARTHWSEGTLKQALRLG